MRYLIDGYNLLFALGELLPGRTLAPAGLEHARLRLLDRLERACGDRASALTVVFDANTLPRRAAAETSHHGIRVLFAVGHAEADDLIEELVRKDASPRQLTVVSNDHRVQQAARRKQCGALTCNEFLDWLERPAAPPKTEEVSLKPDVVADEETRRWLAEWGGLEKDPELKDLFEP